MTIVSLIPPIVDGHATVRDADDTLSVLCYWVLPFVALGLAMLVTSKYPDWFVEASGGDEAAPAAVGSPDTLSVPIDNAAGRSSTFSPQTSSMPSGIAGEPPPRPMPTPKGQSNWPTQTH